MVLSSLSAAFGQLSDGLLNYWNFEGNFADTAGTVPGASSTVNDNGTPQATVTIQPGGPLGRFGQFNRGYVSVPNSADVIAAGESLTISAWFQVASFTTSWQALIAHGEGSDYRIARRGGDPVMAYAGGTGDIGGGPAVTDSQWHHVVSITEAGVSTRLWIDGALVATGGAPNLTNNGAGQMQIGGNPNAGGREWNGRIDDVGMWSRPLTPAEIGEIYTSGRAGTPLSGLFVVVDTDMDGLPDLWETLYGLNPNSADGNDGAAGDPDGDGLTNALEFDPHKTKPNVADTDGDTLSDGAEVNTHHTNPTVVDTDSDSVPDGQEVTLGSNPTLVDSDGDGATDGTEVANGTNAAVANAGFNFGLVAYWPLDADFNSAVNGYTATAAGTNPIPHVPGKFGNAILLDGNDQFLQVDGDENVFDFKGGQNMTVSAWFTADTIDTDWQCLIAKGDAGNNWRLHRRGADQPPEMSFSGGAGDLPKHNTPLSIGTGFIHNVVAISRHGVDTKLYLDGVAVATGSAPNLGDSLNPMRIGSNPDTNPSRFWEGKIDDVALWSRALSEAEVEQIWNQGKGTSIEDLLGSGVLFQFTQVVYDKAADKWTLTWASKPNKTYTLNYSTNLVDFGSDISDNIASGGDTTTYGPFPNPVPSQQRTFFRVTEN